MRKQITRGTPSFAILTIPRLLLHELIGEREMDEVEARRQAGAGRQVLVVAMHVTDVARGFACCGVAVSATAGFCQPCKCDSPRLSQPGSSRIDLNSTAPSNYPNPQTPCSSLRLVYNSAVDSELPDSDCRQDGALELLDSSVSRHGGSFHCLLPRSHLATPLVYSYLPPVPLLTLVRT